ncbi:MAG TPA: peptide chain release factor N(5)-glutamine methyltransferase [Gaiellaceae bacterium]|nr:peptide chain release factor N(5)-glutamine methyltransferase [Gaiellaceae bacterium]
MKVARALAETTERLTHAGCETPRVDAEILVAHVLGVARSELALEPARKLSGREGKELERLVSRREAREPLAYVLGEWGFRRLTLAVDRRVLVPRPETEVVVERCLARLSGKAEPRVLDVGTGSGAIALALADEHPGALVTGIDASPDALEVAGANALRAGLAVTLREWDLFHGLPGGPWDIVVSNPPYVLPGEIDALEPEVREWEPREALIGVGATEAVGRGALAVLERGGALVLEVSAVDAARVAALLGALGYLEVTTTRDLAGRDRVVEGVLAA